MAEREHPLAIVTGASSGIGFELARCCGAGGLDLVIAGRADMLTKLGTEKKQLLEEVARIGFDAMMKGDGDVVAGWSNKLRAEISAVVPSTLLAEQHRKMAAPGTATKS